VPGSRRYREERNLLPALSLERRASEEALLDAAQQVADRLGAWIAQDPTGWFDWGQGREDEGLRGCSSGRGAVLEGPAMRLVTFRRGAELRPGALVGDRILDLCAAFAHGEREAGRDASEGAVRARYGASVLEFIERAEAARPAAEELLARADRLPEGLFVPLAGTELAAPIPRPTSMRDGYAFRQHVESARRNRGLPMIPEFDLFPVFYFTNHQAVVGPGPLPVGPLQRDRLDFELEAAIVVGRQGRDLRASEADAHVFGYMIMNDWSARAVQMEEMKLSLGPAKGKDFATGLGPVLVTRDELEDRRIPGPRGDRYDLAMTASVNGRQLSSGNLRDMHWTFAELLERISDGVTVFPGDVIGSGTVGTGCLLELNGSKITDNQWLQPGDQVSLSIERLGVLENTIVAAG
jgi:fumarylacetoacetate (FAA) hydrolase